MSSPARTARRTHSFTESVIREMTRIATRHGATNLAQGFPDFAAPELLKEAACRAIRTDVNQYAVTWGAPPLRQALVEWYARRYAMEVDGDTELTVTCGATEAMITVMLAAVDPGDEVIVFEPFYENYGPDAVLCEAAPVFVPLDPPDYRIDPDRLRDAVTDRTRAIVVNTPNNPTGRVFTRDELGVIADICRERDILAITDEIYEHIVYEGEHLPLAMFAGMRDRTAVVSGLSKTFSITGWRIGTIVAPAELTGAIRKVHDFLTVGAPAPLQEACAVGIRELESEYYDEMRREYAEKRSVVLKALTEAGFSCSNPEGAYYVLADFSELADEDDVSFSYRLVREAGVAPVPGSSFFSEPDRGRNLIRFAFCKKMDTLLRAGERLADWSAQR
ncbi:MAG: aminotransferase class I/II-fold pyridoxal phosphate-dependent enzyme [Gemmatimonadetes bacterium]|nr:aminotransferase class I/II-fold pyridoxal phosphate-dependent enzyme [Gemmatimonadota bacterium]